MLAPHAQIVELLCTIPRVRAQAAQVLIAECGLDMTAFPTVEHFAFSAAYAPTTIDQPVGDARDAVAPDPTG